MKSRRSISSTLNSSSTRNSLAYVIRARRIASATSETRLSSLDSVQGEYDRLQYVLAYSNLHQNPDDIFGLAREKAVTAENLREEAEEYSKAAENCRKKARSLTRDAAAYNCPVYREYAAVYEEDAEWYEDEARRCYDWANETKNTADYFQYEAEDMVKDEEFVSSWERWLDM